MLSYTTSQFNCGDTTPHLHEPTITLLARQNKSPSTASPTSSEYDMGLGSSPHEEWTHDCWTLGTKKEAKATTCGLWTATPNKTEASSEAKAQEEANTHRKA